MATLTDDFIKRLADNEGNPEVCREVAEMVLSAPITPETNGLLAWMYHEGIGVQADLDKSFELAERAAFEGGDGLGYFLLGYMCDNIETPDQAEGGERQKYDHYDAERFYEKCAEIESRWSEPARLWLGDYYLDMAKGGDPDLGVEYYESIADNNSEAAGALSDYFWNLVMPEYFDDEEWVTKLFKWTSVAAELDPENYSYRLGWLYADGLGCDKNPENSLKYFSEACTYGDRRGAEAVAQCYREYLEENPDLSEDEKAECEALIEEWDALAEKMHKEELDNIFSDIDNLDKTEEED